MAIYLVVPLGDDLSKLQEALTRAAGSPSSVYKLRNNRGFLVQYPGTTTELSDAAGVASGSTKGTTGEALITLIGSYWGVGPNDMWEWLASRWGK